MNWITMRAWVVGLEDRDVVVHTESGAVYRITGKSGEVSGGSHEVHDVTLVGSAISHPAGMTGLVPGFVVEGGSLIFSGEEGWGNSSRIVEIMYEDEFVEREIEKLTAKVDEG